MFVFTLILRVCIALICLVVLACWGGSMVSPDWFAYSSLLSIAFPYVYMLLFALGLTAAICGKWKWAIIAVGVLFISYKQFSYFLVFRSEEKPPSAVAKKIKILSWNVGSFSSNTADSQTPAQIKKAFFDEIRAVSPDIICLQEAWINKKDNWIDELSQKQYYPYAQYGNTSELDKTLYQGSVILSRFPIDKKSNPIRSSLRNHLARAAIHTPIGKINVLSIHFQSNRITPKMLEEIKHINYDEKSKEFTVSIFKKISAASKIRSSQIEEVNAICSTLKHPFALCADLNDVAGSYNYSILRNNCADAFLEKGSGFRRTFWKNGVHVGIDFIFADPSFRIVYYRQDKIKASDHYPHYIYLTNAAP